MIAVYMCEWGTQSRADEYVCSLAVALFMTEYIASGCNSGYSVVLARIEDSRKVQGDIPFMVNYATL